MRTHISHHKLLFLLAFTFGSLGFVEAAGTPRFGKTAIKLRNDALSSFETCELLANNGSIEREIQPGDKLMFSYGIKPGYWNKWKSPIRYQISATSDGADTILFKGVLNPASTPAHRGWQEGEATLDAFAGKKISIHFIAQSDDPAKPGSLLWGGIRIGNFERKTGELNVILISLDTLRGDHLGIGGYSRPTSPQIDAWAKTGAYFTQAISVAPWTKPSHFSMLTGLFPSSHNMVRYDEYDPYKEELNSGIVMLQQILRQQGYLTQAFTGSAYVAADYGYYRGFDHFVESGQRPGGDAQFIFDNVKEWLGKNVKNKFFLFVHTYEIHAPYRHDSLLKKLKIKDVKTPHFVKGFETHQYFTDHPEAIPSQVARYDSGILYLDGLLGELRKHLYQAQLTDSTIVVILSDHGEELMQRGFLMTHGVSLYDDMLRIPFIMINPKKITPQKIDGYQAQQTDLLPTLLDLLQIPQPKTKIDGRSLVPLLAGQSMTGGEFAFSEATGLGPEKKSIRSTQNGVYKFILDPHISSLTKEIYKPHPNFSWKDKLYPEYQNMPWNTTFKENDGRAFYNLTEDPGEMKNRMGQGGEIEKTLTGKLIDFIHSVGKSTSPKSPTVSKEPADPELLEKLKSLGY